jgi:hypothetical protein
MLPTADDEPAAVELDALIGDPLALTAPLMSLEPGTALPGILAPLNFDGDGALFSMTAGPAGMAATIGGLAAPGGSNSGGGPAAQGQSGGPSSFNPPGLTLPVPPVDEPLPPGGVFPPGPPGDVPPTNPPGQPPVLVELPPPFGPPTGPPEIVPPPNDLPPGEQVPVPEPGTIVLVGGGALTALLRKVRSRSGVSGKG